MEYVRKIPSMNNEQKELYFNEIDRVNNNFI